MRSAVFPDARLALEHETSTQPMTRRHKYPINPAPPRLAAQKVLRQDPPPEGDTSIAPLMVDKIKRVRADVGRSSCVPDLVSANQVGIAD